MASSPTETLEQIEAIYADGLEAVLSDDFARIEPLLDRAATLIGELSAPADDDDDASAAREKTREAWAKMCAAMQTAMNTTRTELASNRRGQRVTRAYGDGIGRPQTRHRAEA